jgi:hypothetical protein
MSTINIYRRLVCRNQSVSSYHDKYGNDIFYFNASYNTNHKPILVNNGKLCGRLSRESQSLVSSD